MQMSSNENNSAVSKEELTYAGFMPRFIAFLIDGFIVGIASFMIKYIFFGEIMTVEYFNKSIVFTYSIVDILSCILTLSYFIICIYCTETTLGKYIMKLKVVRKDGGKLSLFNIIYRETIARFISSFLCVGYILIFIDKEKAALHDMFCDSRVIYACNVKKTVYIRKQFVQPQYVNPPYSGPANAPHHPYGGPVNASPSPYNGPQDGLVNRPMPSEISQQGNGNISVPSHNGSNNDAAVPSNNTLQNSMNEGTGTNQESIEK